MTDNEIVKALECCVDWCGNVSCWDCPLKNTGCIHFDKLKETLDLINRQKAEIFKEKNKNSKLRNERNRLKAEVERLTAERDAMHQDVIAAEEYAWQCKTAKAEAYKEFADLSIKRICEQVSAPTPSESYVVERCNQVIDNLLKEMVGDNNA